MVTKLKPYNPSASDLVADWHVLDAKGKVLGRIASEAATLLMGKHRPTYVPHMLSGDFVVIINAAEVMVTGNKADQIVYRRHSQKPGKLKEIPYRRVQDKFPERVIEHAVRGMLPKNKLGERMIRRLKVYAGEEHPHESQLTWTAGRPEREAAAAAEAEEVARKRAEQRKRAAAKKEIAAEATAKNAEPDVAEEKPKRSRRTPAKKADKTEAAAATAVAEPESGESEEKAVEKPAAEKKTPARRSSGKASATKATTTRKRASSTSKSSEASEDKEDKPKAKASASKSRTSSKAKSSSTRKKPTTSKEDE